MQSPVIIFILKNHVLLYCMFLPQKAYGREISHGLSMMGGKNSKLWVDIFQQLKERIIIIKNNETQKIYKLLFFLHILFYL